MTSVLHLHTDSLCGLAKIISTVPDNLKLHSCSLSLQRITSVLHLNIDSPCGLAKIASTIPAAMDCNIKTIYGLNKKVTSVKNVRKLTKLDMKLNDALPNIEVDPVTYAVTADGVHLTCAAATIVPLSRNYFLF
ncbi:urease isoform X1 [Tanacetum coccineum]